MDVSTECMKRKTYTLTRKIFYHLNTVDSTMLSLTL